MPLGALIFYLVAALTIGSALIVVLSRNIVYSAFSLLGTFMGVAGLYALLAADFVAVIQILVYVGGILVLIIFAVMLTHRIDDVAVSNRSVGRLPAALIVGAVGVLMGIGVMAASWAQKADVQVTPTTYGIGDAFLGPYILPFELASIVLLVVLIGAVVVSRKEIREETGS
ncbi:MAG TPA: NADH-quinone oxidoreductase subunit J [Candidatus Binatia bacterium]|jgi:NADH-quinone oxidoreductase subunit J|nr:NADH-quinone oxidoreductase subunit J [Candidatus Binatia bacterium]